jgi:hypothetical protein
MNGQALDNCHIVDTGNEIPVRCEPTDSISNIFRPKGLDTNNRGLINCYKSETSQISSESNPLPLDSLEIAVRRRVSDRERQGDASSQLQLIENNHCDSDKIGSRHGRNGMTKIDRYLPDAVTAANDNNSNCFSRKRQRLSPTVVDDGVKCSPSRRRYQRRNSFVMLFPATEFLDEIQSSINDEC